MRTRSAVAAITSLTLLVAAADAAIRIPKVDNVAIDANVEDWTGRGARVEILTPVGPRFSRSDFDAEFRVAWDDRGLLLFGKVHDPVATESDNPENLWQNDSIELFVAECVGGVDRVQFLLAPGTTEKHPEPRQHAIDSRREALKSTPAQVEMARAALPGGYAMEIRVPWSVLGRDSAVSGDGLALQFYANTGDTGAPRRKLVLHPTDNTHENSHSMRELVLSEDDATHVQSTLSASYERFRRIRAEVRTVPLLIGEPAVLSMRSVDLDLPPVTQEVVISAGPDGLGYARVVLAIPDYFDPELSVAFSTAVAPTVRLGDLRRDRNTAISDLAVGFQPAVFSGTEFPAAGFENPERAEDLLGEYRIEQTLYNDAMEVVTSAEKPGRYGAVIDIHAEDGAVFRRFRTLFRTEQEVRWWNAQFAVQVQWPAEVGIDPIVAAEQSGPFSDHYREMFLESATRGMGAVALAGLHEIEPGAAPVSIMADAQSRDRAWWVQLKRKLYESELRFTEPVARPIVLEQAIAPTLRPGSESEAGFAPGTTEKLTALLSEWAAESGEPFTVSVSRNGIVMIDEAYGTRDGNPMTRNTPSIVYSISKAASGTAFMMAVDQGLISLDDTPGKYLAPWRALGGRQPTMRQLFTHTAGMRGHWGDELNDFEEIVAAQLPYLQVGQRHEYNGASLALGCKVLEQVSGESLVDFYTRRLFGPLEMNDTTQTNSSWRMYSTAADLAKLGQMLLNGGAYGKLRFFSPDTHQLMLPHPLVKELGPDTQREWGIGLSWMNDEKTMYGHGSASSSTFLVHPEKKLVITMARNAAGPKHGDFHKRFLDLIVDSAVD